MGATLAGVERLTSQLALARARATSNPLDDTLKQSVAPAMNYAELIKAAFDLYRRALLEALGLQMLSTLTEERQLWKNLCAFFAHGLTPDEDFHFE